LYFRLVLLGGLFRCSGSDAGQAGTTWRLVSVLRFDAGGLSYNCLVAGWGGFGRPQTKISIYPAYLTAKPLIHLLALNKYHCIK
jgi:hypothetical protein